MAKEVMAFTESDIKGMTLTTSEFDTLKYLSAHAGVEMDEGAQQDFIAQRNARINEIVSISELKAKAEKLADYLKTVLKHSFNVGNDEDLPKNVSWSKQTFTEKFTDTEAAVQKLIEIEGKNKVVVHLDMLGSAGVDMPAGYVIPDKNAPKC